jgi:hypothetical protein
MMKVVYKISDLKNLSPKVQAHEPCSIGKVTLSVTVTRPLLVYRNRSLNNSAENKWLSIKPYMPQTRYIDAYSTAIFADSFLQYGRPFIILREQAKKTRTHGLEAIKVSIRRFSWYAYETFSSHTFWPRRQSPTLSARLLDREVTLVFVSVNCTSPIKFRS